MHGFLLLKPKIIVPQDGEGVIFDSQLAGASITAFQIAIGYLALDVFAMRTIIASTTIAIVRLILFGTFQTVATIDTEFMNVIIAQSNCFVFAVFADVELTVLVLGIVAIAKVLRVAVDIIEAGNTFTAMKAFVSIVGRGAFVSIARLVRAVASEKIQKKVQIL
jgi:hypothetical protein